MDVVWRQGFLGVGIDICFITCTVNVRSHLHKIATWCVLLVRSYRPGIRLAQTLSHCHCSILSSMVKKASGRACTTWLLVGTTRYLLTKIRVLLRVVRTLLTVHRQTRLRTRQVMLLERLRWAGVILSLPVLLHRTFILVQVRVVVLLRPLLVVVRPG